MMALALRKFGNGSDRFVNNAKRAARTSWHHRWADAAARGAGARARRPVDDRATGASPAVPSSDAVQTLSTCVRELVEAIKPARDARLHLTIADAHATTRIPVSTLRWLCKHKPELLGAQKHEGVWYISRVKFERYLTTSDREARTERATQQPRTGNEEVAA